MHSFQWQISDIFPAPKNDMDGTDVKVEITKEGEEVNETNVEDNAVEPAAEIEREKSGNDDELQDVKVQIEEDLATRSEEKEAPARMTEEGKCEQAIKESEKKEDRKAKEDVEKKSNGEPEDVKVEIEKIEEKEAPSMTEEGKCEQATEGGEKEEAGQEKEEAETSYGSLVNNLRQEFGKGKCFF